MDLEELAVVARELYGVRPEDFVSARTAAVRRARSSGDRALATAVGGLRKPAPAAWVVDLLAAQGALDAAVDLGPSIRAAQEHADPEEISRLRKQRRSLVDALGHAGADLAEQAGHRVNAGVIDQVAATLEAAMADSHAGAAVRSGLLVRPLEAVGFEPVDLAGAVAVPGVLPSPPARDEDTGPAADLQAQPPAAGPPAQPPAAGPPVQVDASPDDAASDASRAASRAAAPAARDREARRARERSEADRALDEARARAQEADEALDALEARLDAADTRQRDLEDRRHDLERQLREVRRALTDAVRDREWLDGEHAAAERAADDAHAEHPSAERRHRALDSP